MTSICLNSQKTQYRVEMCHMFEFERPWEMLRRDPKSKQCPTSNYVQSKRSRNSSLVDVSDAWTYNDLNADTN